MKDQILRQGKPPTAPFPRLDRDKPIKAPRASFGLALQSAIRYIVTLMQSYRNV
jgi:hypothetical protein